MIKELSFIFNEKNGPYSVYFDFSNLKEMSMLAVLIFYKFTDYSFKNRLLHRPSVAASREFWDAIFRFGFDKLFETFTDSKLFDIAEYRNLRVKEEGGFLIAPQPLIRNEPLSKNKLQTSFLPSIQQYYAHKPEVIPNIFMCLSELVLNFWEHATEDSGSVMLAYGSKSHIEIACADTGQGIATTLRPILERNMGRSMSDSEIISHSVDKGVTSKVNSYHMGYGLYLINRLVSAMEGSLYLFSEHGMLSNVHGITTSKSNSFWQGAVIYISLPLHKHIALSSLQEPSTLDANININWQ
jgi:hypothetical protein